MIRITHPENPPPPLPAARSVRFATTFLVVANKFVWPCLVVHGF